MRRTEGSASATTGDRLTEQEMTAYMNNLVNKAYIFGKDASFVWAPAQIWVIRIHIGPKSRTAECEQSSLNLLKRDSHFI